MSRRRSRSQAGQTLVMFAMMMAFVFVGLLALVGDGDVLMFAYDQASSAALVGAQTGASDVDLDLLYTRNRRQLADGTLSPNDARTMCEDAATQGLGASVSAKCEFTDLTHTAVIATVTKQVTLPIPLFGTTAQVKAVRTARAVFGGINPQ